MCIGGVFDDNSGIVFPYFSMKYIQNLLLCPPWGGVGGGGVGRPVVFSANPVGVAVATCLHSVSLLNGQILAKLTQIYHWEGEKC